MKNEALYLAVCIVAALIPLFASYRQYQMLQQNSYFPSRYFKWMYESYFTQLTGLVLVFCAVTVIIRFSVLTDLIILALLLVIQAVSAVKTHKKSIKKLVFTGRIKRMYAVQSGLVLLVMLLSLVTAGVVKGFFFTVLMLLSVFSPLLTGAVWVLTFPIEKFFGYYYIGDAKKTIEDCRNLTVIGVTGSYGKTSTKFILARILSEKYNVLATPQSFNTTMGVVKTIRERLRPTHDIFVCEMGAKNRGDIKEICDIVKPKHGIITAVGAQHMETFKSLNTVFRTKFELYDAVKQNDGDILVNLGSECIRRGITNKECITYGINEGEYYAENITYSKSGSAFTLVLECDKINVETRLLGKHNVINIVGAAAIAYRLGVTPDQIRYAVSRLEPTEHRLQIKPSRGGSIMIDDAYNANPEGCLEAVNVLSHFEGMRKAIITPGLVELGEKEYDFNYKLGLAATRVCDIIILVGKTRSVPFKDAIAKTDFNPDNVFVVGSFAEAMAIYSRFADDKTVVLVENDLPDNYLK